MRTKFHDITRLWTRLWRNDNGAALVEYSILLGIITVTVLATLITVANWVGDQWVALESQLAP